ncbi:MAG: hypothetical protein H6625_09545 [Bdellovibrionaceae bacterium]|nr:hypothetical protein [Pseudobdellovibrionaceae bacterium]
MSRASVSVFSCFDRGQWLAAALAEKNYEVKLFDVSNNMGRWAPEDWEGPFGLYHLENLTQLQNERITEQDYFESIDEGMILWLKEGPLELKGPLTLYNLESLGLKESYEQLLNYYKNGKYDELKLYLENHSFEKTWLIYFSLFLAANRYSLTDLFLDSKMEALSFSVPYSIRRATRKGLDKAFQWCESKGVQCFRDVEIKDISFNGRHCEGVEVSSFWSGVVDTDYYVWMLTGEETSRFKESVISKLFPTGVLQSHWAWIRYRMSIKSKEHYATLPLKFFVIDDIFLPWTHENLCIVQKGVSQGDLDCFVRVPVHHRFQKNYLESMSNNICKSLLSRIPVKDIEVLDMPQDYHYTEHELGPTRFPVYDSEELKKYSHAKFKNLFFSSPEFWSPQDLSRQLKLQEEVLIKIDKLESEKSKKARAPEVEL